jgi:hypothetical protein
MARRRNKRMPKRQSTSGVYAIPKAAARAANFDVYSASQSSLQQAAQALLIL